MTPQPHKLSPHLFFRTVMQVGLSPGRFFVSLADDRRPFTPPLYFIVLCALVNTTLSVLLRPENPPLLIVFFFFLNAIGMPVIIAGLLFGIAQLLCRGTFKSFRKLFCIAAYANVTFLFSWIPGIIWAATLWNFYLIGIGLVKTGPIGGSKAFACIAVALVVLIFLVQLLQPMIRA
jgi:hypothetical protein